MKSVILTLAFLALIVSSCTQATPPSPVVNLNLAELNYVKMHGMSPYFPDTLRITNNSIYFSYGITETSPIHNKKQRVEKITDSSVFVHLKSMVSYDDILKMNDYYYEESNVADLEARQFFFYFEQDKSKSIYYYQNIKHLNNLNNIASYLDSLIAIYKIKYPLD